jgi:hypothetical protein
VLDEEPEDKFTELLLSPPESPADADTVSSLTLIGKSWEIS